MEFNIMARNWTPEARAQQSELIRTWQPWKHSTGARTPQGKAISAQNRAKSLARAQKRIDDARLALKEAVKERDRLTGNSPVRKVLNEMKILAKMRRR
jgi:hypothetical protein